MLLRLAVGRAGSGKSTWVYQGIQQSLRRNALPVYLIVPEQFTLQAEKELIAALGTRGLMQARVVSPSKLASDVFAQVAQDRKTVIDQCGLAMAMRAAAGEIADGLKAFRSVLAYPGFSLEMVKLISEFRRFDITSETLIEKSTAFTGALKAKTEDIALIFRQFNQYLEERNFTDADSNFNNFIDHIVSASFLQGCDFYFDGFDYLSPQHCRMMQQLLTAGNSVSVTQDFDTLDSGDSGLFLSARSNIAKLNAVAAEIGAQVQWHHLLRDQRGNPMPPDIAHLESSLFAHPAQPILRQGDVSVCRAMDVAEEVEAAASWIMGKAQGGEVHWREFALQCADHDAYAPVISRVFEQYGIPVFIDKRREIIRHPAVRFVLSLVKLLEREFRMDDVLRLAKTGYLKLLPHEEDLLEVYLTAFAPRGLRSWSREWTKGQDSYDLNLLNRCRKEIHGLAAALTKQAGGRKATGKLWARALYSVLEERKFDEYLDAQALELKNTGLIEEGAVTERIWNVVMEVLDQLSEIIDEQVLDAKELSGILQSGFSSMEVGIIPTGVDQVQAGSLGRSKFSGIRHMLILGACEGMLGNASEGGILTDKDLDVMIGQGVHAGRGSEVKDSQRRFMLYEAVTKGSESLFISWPLNGTANSETKPDLRLEKIIELLQMKPEDILDSVALINSVPCAAAGFTRLPVLLRGCAEGKETSSKKLELVKWYLSDATYGEKVSRLICEIQGRPQPEVLPAAGLASGASSVTASQLETYHDCPFRHFVDYVLRPQEWKQHGMESSDTGMFLHAAMERFSKRLSLMKPDTEALAGDVAAMIMAEEADKLAQEFGYGVLQSDARLRWTGGNLRRTCMLAAQTFASQLSRGEFRPMGQEVRFGRGGMPAAPLALPGGGFSFLEGRIDRLDVLHKGEEDLYRIIDYKSGIRTIDMTDAVNGLSVQTWLYAYALSTVWQKFRGRPGKPAGSYIFPLIDPWVEEGDDVDKNRLAKLRLNGWCIKDDDVIQAMDRLTESGRSELFNFNLARGTGFYEEATSNAVVSLVARQAARSVDEIKRGCIATHPWRSGREFACQSCSYGALCRFQVAEFRRFRQLLGKDEVNALVEQEKKGEHGHALD